MSQTLIKICGIKTPQIAFDTIRLGADFVGVIFAKKSKRYVNIQKAQEISNAVREAGGKIVGVFSEQQATEITDIVDALQLDYVQLHGDNARQAVVDLPMKIKKIFAVVAGHDNDNKYISLLQERDFLLYDNAIPGSGQTFDWQHFEQPARSWFLAGGLNAANITQAIKQLKPYAVDVSSGVEDESGEKNLDQIKKLIEAVRIINA